MTVFDLAVIGVVGLSAVLAFARGFVRVVVSLLAWVVALVVAIQYVDLIAMKLPPFIGSGAPSAVAANLRHIVAFAAIVLAVLLLGALIGWLISRLVRVVGLGFVDRTLGAVLGVARGLLIVVLGVLIAGMTSLPKQDWWQNAMFAPPLVTAALSLKPWLPQGWAEQLDFGMQKRPNKPSARTGVA